MMDLQELSDLMKSDKNFSTYRAAMFTALEQEATSVVIPYLGMTSSHLDLDLLDLSYRSAAMFAALRARSQV